ncbi:MAG: transaldolase [Actinomycetota bacterium]|nr:transaldolase [Actinomycetota bacterium]
MTKAAELYDQVGQSIWIDNLKRSYLKEGRLATLVAEGVRGVTSNPTIFQKAIAGGDDYDAEFADLIKKGSVEEAYWGLVIDDITNALRVLRPVYDSSDGTDGFVSLEVSPALAHDTEGTAADARRFHTQIAEPNLLVKIPATAAGIPAISQMIGEGRSINITLIFGLDRYADVIEAYLSGLEACQGDLASVASVASFFVSRVDTEVDRRLDAIGSPEALALRGKAAVAQAKLAYRLFRQRFTGERWEALAAQGARLQRPLWASTSTKNPAYPDLLYVEPLMGPDTVNTVPDATLTALEDHGTVSDRIEDGVDEAERTLASLHDVGVDMDDVAKVLEDEGVAAFTKSFDELLQSLTDKANALANGS